MIATEVDLRRTGRGWKWVGLSMGMGAAYDLAFAAAILAFGREAATLLGLTFPKDPVYLRLNGVLLLLLAGVYALPMMDPMRYRGVVAVAAAGRLLGALFLTYAWLRGRSPVFLALGMGDLALGAAHATLLRAALRGTGLPSR